jgi:hypothetical protein
MTPREWFWMLVEQREKHIEALEKRILWYQRRIEVETDRIETIRASLEESARKSTYQ